MLAIKTFTLKIKHLHFQNIMCMLPTLLSKTWVSTVKGPPLKNDKYRCNYEKNFMDSCTFVQII